MPQKLGWGLPVPAGHENLYSRWVAALSAAVRDEGQPSATGEDGVRSLANALATLESTRTGKRVAVHYA